MDGPALDGRDRRRSAIFFKARQISENTIAIRSAALIKIIVFELLLFVNFLSGSNDQKTSIIPLRLKFSFPSEKMADKGVFLSGAVYMFQEPGGNLYVSNTKEGQILCFNEKGHFLNKFGAKGRGPNEIIAPRKILLTKDQIIIQDIGNSKLAYFDKSGKLIKNVKLPKTYDAMIIDNEKKLIYATHMNIFPGEKLIDILNLEGELISSFGELLDYKNRTTTANEGNLALTDNHEIIFAFRFFSIVRKYSSQGVLLAEHKINYGRQITNEKKNRQSFKESLVDNHSPSLFAVIDGISIRGNRLFVLNCFPFLEVLELDVKCSIKNIYQSTEQLDYFAINFSVARSNAATYFYVLQVMPDNIVNIFSQK